MIWFVVGVAFSAIIVITAVCWYAWQLRLK
jgi:hypothetical protein